MKARSLVRTVLALCLLGAGVPKEAPFSLPTSFENAYQRRPDPSCAPDRVTVTLHADATYVDRVIDNGREMYEGYGSWRFDARNARIVLNNHYGCSPDFYRVLDGRSLESLDKQGKRYAWSCADLHLHRTAQVIEFAGVMQPVTLTSDL